MDDTNTTQDQPARYAKGKRPEFYADPAMDEAMSMIMVLCSELSTLRDRLDTVEAIAESKGQLLQEEIDAFVPNQSRLDAREARRQDLLERLFFVTNKRAAELASDDTADRYEGVLKDLAEE